MFAAAYNQTMTWSVRLPGLPLLALSAFAQQRPKVGLVLEGGGASGLAHIGVLQWLEQNDIPVDAVAGTSMGGLVLK